MDSIGAGGIMPKRGENMPTRQGKYVVGKYVELPLAFAAEVERFAKSRGETFKTVIEAALRRHLDNPPPLPTLPPLPPVTSPVPAKKKGGKKS